MEHVYLLGFVLDTVFLSLPRLGRPRRANLVSPGCTLLIFMVIVAAADRMVVQFAVGADDKNAGSSFAVKFFLSKQAFAAERAIYKRDGLLQALPRLHGLCSNADHRMVDAHGNPLPPCIVLERGESLQERLRGAPLGTRSAAKVCTPSRSFYAARHACTASTAFSQHR